MDEYLTDHRVPKDSIFMLDTGNYAIFNAEGTPIHPFADRSFVKEDCDCDYCTWEG